MAQFRREAERGFRLVGPSLLPVYELREIDGYHFMTMPYVEGTALRDIVKQRVAYRSGEEPETVHHLVTLNEPDYLPRHDAAMAQAARALASVHEQRIAHRDIKPANILLDNHRSERSLSLRFRPGARSRGRHPRADARWRRHTHVHGAGTIVMNHRR